jgi:hypothetical protein
MTVALAASLEACTSTGIQDAQGPVTSDAFAIFARGEIRLNCDISCSGSFGTVARSMHAKYEQGQWRSLAMGIAQVGWTTDLTYFYLGRAAEGLGLSYAAKTYYRLSIDSKGHCQGLLANVCKGLVFPRDAQARLEGIWASELAAAQKSREQASPTEQSQGRDQPGFTGAVAAPPVAAAASTPSPPARLAPSPSVPAATSRVTSTGSGFVVAKDSVVTNHHVIKDCTAVAIRFGNVTSSAKVAADAAGSDLALLTASQPLGLQVAIRASAALGEDATVAGYPLAGLLSTDLVVTSGQVNSLAGLGNDPTMLQVSAPIQPGNSGGPLLDRSGSVVGVVVAKLNVERLAKVTGDMAQNVNFAIKPEVLRLFLDANRVQYRSAPLGQRIDGIVLAERARQFTVQVLCER